MKKLIICAVIFLFLAGSVLPAVGVLNNIKLNNDILNQNFTNSIMVDNEGDGDYISIQEAVDNAEPGDIIKIYSGLYNEIIHIYTPSITLEGVAYELGAGIDVGAPIIDGNTQNNVIDISADLTTIQGLLIVNSSKNELDAGIIINSDKNTILGNYIAYNRYGINCNNNSENTIQSNIIEKNTIDGIYLYLSDGNTIEKNTIEDNGFQGIYLTDSNSNYISDNTIKLNGWDGIHIYDLCIDNTIYKNEISSNNIDGIKIFHSGNSNNFLIKNIVQSNRFNGIHIMFSDNNTINDNTIELNLLDGIHLGNSDNNVISRNTISSSYLAGLLLFSGSSGNIIYHNNFYNNNAIDNGDNKWDNDYPVGGNYWDEYWGEDADGDGIGDIPYDIPGGENQDRYPFIQPIQPPLKPSRPFGTTYGRAGEEYIYSTQTTDPNSDKVQYGWDWNADKIVDHWTDFYESGEVCSVTNFWEEQGDYVIHVIAMDEYGIESEWSEPLTVTMSKTRELNIFFNRLFQNFPYTQKLIESLMNLFF